MPMGLLIVAILAYFVIEYFNDKNSNPYTFRQRRNAIDLLDERYAMGDIDDEEYNRKKRILRD